MKTETAAPLAATAWEFLPVIILRSAGLPFSWLDRLRCPETLAALEAVQAAEQAVAESEKELLSSLKLPSSHPGLSPETRRTHQELVRCVRRAVPPDDRLLDGLEPAMAARLRGHFRTWQAALVTQARAQEQARQVFAREQSSRRAALREMFEQPRLQEAVFLCSPSMYFDGLMRYLAESPGASDKKTRRRERTLLEYLQRFCAKNDTNSFFGPINYGHFQPDAPRFEVKFRSNGTPQSREAFFAYWGACALARAIERDPEVLPSLCPKLGLPYRLRADGCLESVLSGAAQPLSPVFATLIRRADGSTSFGEIAEELTRRSTPREAIQKLFQAALDGGLLITELNLPPGVFRPLDELIHRLTGVRACPGGNRWLQALAEFRMDLAHFARAELGERVDGLAAIERRFCELTGQAQARRKPGQMYADRLLVSEKTLGDVEHLAVGDTLRREWLDGLAPILDLWAVRAFLKQQAFKRWALTAFGQIAGASSTLGLGQWMAGLVAYQIKCPCQWEEDADLVEFERRLKGTLAGRAEDRQIHLPTAALNDLCAPYLPELTHLVASPDLMLAARGADALARGEYTLVVNEVHEGFQVWKGLLCFYPDLDRLEKTIQRAGGTEEWAGMGMLLGPREGGGSFDLELPGWSIEGWAQSVKPADQVLSIADLFVRCCDRRLELSIGPDGPPVRLLPFNPDTPLTQIFGLTVVRGLPIVLGPHTPRLILQGIVMQRERWDLPTADLIAGALPKDGLDLFRLAQAWRVRYGWPARVFVRVPNERKPFYIDLNSYLSVELLAFLLRGNATLTVTEMLPDVDGLWLRREEQPYTSEMRVTALARWQGAK